MDWSCGDKYVLVGDTFHANWPVSSNYTIESYIVQFVYFRGLPYLARITDNVVYFIGITAKHNNTFKK